MLPIKVAERRNERHKGDLGEGGEGEKGERDEQKSATFTTLPSISVQRVHSGYDGMQRGFLIHSVKTDISPAEPPANCPANPPAGDLWPTNPDIRPLPNLR